MPPGTGICWPNSRSGGGRVVVQAVADVAGLPGRVAPGVPGVADLELGELLDVLVDDGREPAQQPGPLARRDVAPGRERGVRPLDRRVGLRRRRPACTSVTSCSVAGLTTVCSGRQSSDAGSHPLEAAPQLPVGHGGVERRRARRRPCSCSGRRPRRRAPRARPPSRRTRRAPPAACAAPWACRRCRRCRSARARARARARCRTGRRPASPPAPGRGSRPRPGTRFSSRAEAPCPTRRTAQVRLSSPQATAVGANEPSAKRL